MAALCWIISIGTFLGGLAAWHDLPHSLMLPITSGLLLASLLCCPLFWRGPIASGWLSGRQRAMACLALVLALPLIMLPPG